MKKVAPFRLNKYMLKLSEYAIDKGLSYRTAYNHFKKNLIPNAFQTESGAIYINEELIVKNEDIWINITELFKQNGYIIERSDSCI